MKNKKHCCCVWTKRVDGQWVNSYFKNERMPNWYYVANKRGWFKNNKWYGY